MKKTAWVHVLVEPHTRAYLRRFARARGLSLSAYVREILLTHVSAIVADDAKPRVPLTRKDGTT